jgi:phosphoglycolate phosphatase-like HAD superfamily hydrolase
MTHKAIAIDLDGTLCRKNTFNIFLKHLLRAQSTHPMRFVKLSAWMCARKMHLISHACMKRHILEEFYHVGMMQHGAEKIWHTQPSSDEFGHAGTTQHSGIIGRPCETMIETVVSEICANANRNVIELLEKCRAEGFTTVLATAAPGLYAEKVASEFGFDFCVATPLPVKKHSWEEMRGTVKRDAVLSLLANRSCELTIAVSDHSDDIPLLTAARQPLLVTSPSGALAPTGIFAPAPPPTTTLSSHLQK